MRRAVAPLAVCFALALALVSGARADDAAALYDPAAVARIDLTLTPDAIDALTADPLDLRPRHVRDAARRSDVRGPARRAQALTRTYAKPVRGAGTPTARRTS
jgi:hypothetical protein